MKAVLSGIIVSLLVCASAVAREPVRQRFTLSGAT
jgi:hypothetical protein